MKTPVFINPVEYSIVGDLRLDVTASSDLDGIQRRVSRMKLLDGTVHIGDMGAVEGDMDRTLVSNTVTEEQADLLRGWFVTYTELVLSLPKGIFLAAPQSFSFVGGTLTARFMVKSRLDA